MLLGVSWLDNAFMHALTTLCGFDDPKDLATISFIPATSQSALIGPPAIIPVPFGADLSNTLPDPCLPKTLWCRTNTKNLN